MKPISYQEAQVSLSRAVFDEYWKGEVASGRGRIFTVWETAKRFLQSAFSKREAGKMISMFLAEGLEHGHPRFREMQELAEVAQIVAQDLGIVDDLERREFVVWTLAAKRVAMLNAVIKEVCDLQG